MKNLSHQLVDPRVALLIELGAELRGGQVLRLRRSLVLLEADAEGFAPYGQFIVAGSGKKGGTQVVMTQDQREALNRAMETYLRDCEAFYHAEQIEDYCLFAPFKIKPSGTATPRNAQESKPMGVSRCCAASTSSSAPPESRRFPAVAGTGCVASLPTWLTTSRQTLAC